MSRPCSAKHCSFAAVSIMVAVFLAVGPNHAEAGPNKPLHSQTKASVAGQTPQDALVINSACDKILRGDFESAQEIVSKSKLRSDELQKMANVQKANESVETIGRDDALSSMNRYSHQETVDADPQLAIGLLVLKSKMIQAGHELAGAAQQSDRASGLQNASVGFQ